VATQRPDDPNPPKADDPNPPKEADSAGVYFVSVEDFEWRPPPKGEPAQRAPDHPEEGDASEATSSASLPEDVS